MLFTTTPSAAHHSFAMFDPTHQLTLQGVVKDFRWTNPHAFIQLQVPDTAGSTNEWSIEMASPEHLLRAGWKPRMLKSGDRVTVVVNPMRDGSKGGQFVSASAGDGTPIGARQSRNAGAAEQ
ncbi:MAG TPA: DUF6152 family protein [Gammaproteobacteria bacterium]|nr:DUF6152 family protein [Gammaproteobacteria bacterium]